MRCLVVLLVASMALGCAADPAGDLPEVAAAGATLRPYPAERLTLAGDRGTVLVRIDGKDAIRIGEFNDRFQEFLLVADRGQEVAEARREALDELILHKIIVLQARKRGHDREALAVASDPYQTDRNLSWVLIRESIGAVDGISDEEAWQYLREHPDEFESVDEARLSEADRVALQQQRIEEGKILLQDRRWKEQCRLWRDRTEIVVSEELLRS